MFLSVSLSYNILSCLLIFHSSALYLLILLQIALRTCSFILNYSLFCVKFSYGICYLCLIRSFCILLFQLLARRSIREFIHVEGQEDRQEDR